MQTHEDGDFNKRLSARAEEVTSRRGSDITAGAPGEEPITEYQAHGVHVRRLPADEQGILRISVGGGIRDESGKEIIYCSYRGPALRCAAILEKALKAMQT